MSAAERGRPWRYAPLLEALGMLAVTLPLALAVHLPTLWFLSPVVLIALTRRSYAAYGFTFSGAGSIRFHSVTSAAVFVPYVVGHYLWGTWWQGATFHFRLPPDFASAAVDQFLLIGLPEESFFRGYLQTQFDCVWGRPYRLWGAHFGIGLPAAAAVFAACHVIYGGPLRLIVFFPGLWYGWLRARTDTVLVPAVYHAVSNLLMQIMLTSFSP